MYAGESNVLVGYFVGNGLYCVDFEEEAKDVVLDGLIQRLIRGVECLFAEECLHAFSVAVRIHVDLALWIEIR
ncbi:hypothetical protein D1F64_14995 [Breoghania sp. L-A4]|nr:hypothetical protein D1F64_14995 [Breoghania sp. L-A4]